jgi:hypothetical protein
MSQRRALPARRQHITQKVQTAGQGADCSSELIGLYDVITCLGSIGLKYRPPPRWRSSAIASQIRHVYRPSLGTPC